MAVYIEPDDRAHFDSPPVWDTIVLEVVEALRGSPAVRLLDVLTAIGSMDVPVFTTRDAAVRLRVKRIEPARRRTLVTRKLERLRLSRDRHLSAEAAPFVRNTARP